MSTSSSQVLNRQLALVTPPSSFRHRHIVFSFCMFDVLVEADTIMNDLDRSSTGFLSNTLSDFKLTFVVVSNAFIVTDRKNGLVAALDAFLKYILDAITLVQANAIMNNCDRSAARFLSNTLSDFKLTFVVVSNTLIVTNRKNGLVAIFDAFLKYILDAISLV